MERKPGVFEKYLHPDEIAPRRLSAADAPGLDRRRSSLPRHKRRKPIRGSMTVPQRTKNTVVPAPRRTAPPSTGPTTWPMFHWKLSTLNATGTSSGGTRLPIVVHHDGEDVPLAIPMPAIPRRRVAGVSSRVDDIRTRNATELMSRIFATSSTARRSRESAAAPENTTAKMAASGLIAAARVTRTGDVVRRSMMKPPTSVTIQTPVLANRPVPSSHRNARLRSGAKSSLTGPQNSREAARVNSHVIAHTVGAI